MKVLLEPMHEATPYEDGRSCSYNEDQNADEECPVHHWYEWGELPVQCKVKRTYAEEFVVSTGELWGYVDWKTGMSAPSHLVLVDDSRAWFEGEVEPDPFREHASSIPEPDQKENVDETPKQPGKET